MWYDGVIIIKQNGVSVMQNPFLNRVDDPYKSDYLTSVCSINRIRLRKLPLYGIDDSIEGLTVKEFFSTKLVIEEIKKYHKRLDINLDKYEEKKLPKIPGSKILPDHGWPTGRSFRSWCRSTMFWTGINEIHFD